MGGLLSTSLVLNMFLNTKILHQKMPHLRPLELARLQRWKLRLRLMRPVKLRLKRKSNFPRSDKLARLVLHMKLWKTGNSTLPKLLLPAELVAVVGKDVGRAVVVEEAGVVE